MKPRGARERHASITQRQANKLADQRYLRQFCDKPVAGLESAAVARRERTNVIALEREVELAELEAKRRALLALAEAQAMAAYHPGRIAARLQDGQLELWEELWQTEDRALIAKAH